MARRQSADFLPRKQCQISNSEKTILGFGDLSEKSTIHQLSSILLQRSMPEETKCAGVNAFPLEPGDLWQAMTHTVCKGQGPPMIVPSQ